VRVPREPLPKTREETKVGVHKAIWGQRLALADGSDTMKKLIMK